MSSTRKMLAAAEQAREEKEAAGDSGCALGRSLTWRESWPDRLTLCLSTKRDDRATTLAQFQKDGEYLNSFKAEAIGAKAQASIFDLPSAKR